MTAANPYSPPQAVVNDFQDGDVGFSEPKVWSASGRIGRLRYLAYTMAGYLLLVVAGALSGALAGALNLPGVVMAVTVVAGSAYFVLAILSGIQRAHDMDWSGWTVLLALIPLVALIWIFKGGTAGANRYGAPPPPNTSGIKLLALLLPVVMIVGILAAIALPQYQHYTQRAKAMQAP